MDSPIDVEITPRRLDELMRWHGTDESRLPPTHTLQNLSRDTIAALEELQRSRERIERLRAAMSRAFWAADSRELHAILLRALGPPPPATPRAWSIDSDSVCAESTSIGAEPGPAETASIDVELGAAETAPTEADPGAAETAPHDEAATWTPS